jgi:hypothetical protein
VNKAHVLGSPCSKNAAHVVAGFTIRNKAGRWCVACERAFRFEHREELSAQQAARRAAKREAGMLA